MAASGEVEAEKIRKHLARRNKSQVEYMFLLLGISL